MTQEAPPEGASSGTGASPSPAAGAAPAPAAAAFGTALVVVTVALAPLPKGGVTAGIAVAMTALVIGGCALLAVSRALSGTKLYVPLIALPVALAALWTSLLLVPLPTSLLETLAPALVEDRARAFALIAGGAGTGAANASPWSSLAVDAPDTALALVRLLGGLAVVVVFANIADSPRASRRVWLALLVSTVLVIAVAVGSRLLVDGGRTLFAPLVNPNHNARVLGALGALLIGRALMADRSRAERVAFAGVGVIACLLVPLTWSRGGMATAALAVSAVLVVIALDQLRGSSRGRSRGAARAAGLSAGALGLLGVVALLVLGAVVLQRTSDLEDKPIEEVAELGVELSDPMSRTKLAVWPTAIATTRAHPLGVGSGGFGVASAKVIEPGALAEAKYRHVENIVLDTLAAHGFVVGAVLLLVGLFAAFDLARATRRASSRVPLAVGGALVAGDVVDYALELPAPFFLALAAFGLAAARVRHESSRAWAWPLEGRRAVAAVVAVALVATCAAVGALRGSRQRLNDEIIALPIDKRRPVLERAVALHPLDGHYAYQLAVDARAARDPQRAMRALNHVFEVWPGHSRAHLEAARALFALGRVEQAMVEYRVAYRIRRTPDVLREVARRTTDARLLRTAVPDEAVAVHQLAGNLPDRCGPAARKLVVELPTLRDASQDHLAAALEWLEQCNDVTGATRVLRSWFRPLEGPLAARAARFLAERDAPQAIAMSARWLNGSRDKAALLEWRARWFLEHGERTKAEADAHALATASPDVNVRQRAALLQAALREDAGDLHGALLILQESTRTALPDPDALAARVRVARKLGRQDEAGRALDALRRRAPDHPALAATP